MIKIFPAAIAALILALVLTAPAAAQQVNARACNATAVATGGAAVVALSGPYNGFIITNPLTAADQGVAVENLYVNLFDTAAAQGYGNNFVVAPGQPFVGPTLTNSTGVSVVAATTGHRFSCARW